MVFAPERCKAFIFHSNEIIQIETNKWVTEFQSAIKEIDVAAAKTAAKLAKDKAKMEQLGALSIEIENGLNCDDGWKLTIDGEPEKNFSGKKGAIKDIKPGMVVVHATGLIAGEQVQDSMPVSIKGGESASITLKLE